MATIWITIADSDNGRLQRYINSDNVVKLHHINDSQCRIYYTSGDHEILDVPITAIQDVMKGL